MGVISEQKKCYKFFTRFHRMNTIDNIHYDGLGWCKTRSSFCKMIKIEIGVDKRDKLGNFLSENVLFFALWKQKIGKKLEKSQIQRPLVVKVWLIMISYRVKMGI